MKTHRLFISRDLDVHSPFRHLENDLEVHGMSLLTFQAMPFSHIPSCDWLFFYSQQGVRHFFMQLNSSIRLSSRIAAFAPKTARLLKEYGQLVHFIGNGKASDTSAAFQVLSRNERVVFIRAKKSMKSIQQMIENAKEISDLVTYDNQPKEDFSLPFCDFLVFTSPLNAKTYFSKYDKEKGQTIFAIGESTAKMVRTLTGAEAHVPGDPSEQSLINLVNEFM